MPERNAFFDNEESLQQIYEQFPMMLGMSEVVDCGFETISGVEYYYAEGVCAAAYNGNEPGLLSMAMLCDRETGVVHVFWLLAPTLEEWTAQAPAIRELLESVKYTR